MEEAASTRKISVLLIRKWSFLISLLEILPFQKRRLEEYLSASNFQSKNGLMIKELWFRECTFLNRLLIKRKNKQMQKVLRLSPIAKGTEVRGSTVVMNGEQSNASEFNESIKKSLDGSFNNRKLNISEIYMMHKAASQANVSNIEKLNHKPSAIPFNK